MRIYIERERQRDECSLVATTPCHLLPKTMLLALVLFYIQSSSALLVSTENRVSTRNITCQHGSSSMTLFFNCEACLVVTRNYAVQSLLSLAGPGPSGVSYVCLLANDIDAYHENLVQECRNFPRQTLNGYDDFCVASPFNQLRGSYRACICSTNACNFNYTECVRRANPYWDQQPPTFRSTVVQLTNRVKCFRPYEDYRPQIQSYLTPLCSINDDDCKNFIFDNGVLCAISIDRTNQLSRQTLPPSIYVAQVIKFKTVFCNSFTLTSKSIYFSKCLQGETVCMCAVDGCDKDLDTCRTSRAMRNRYLFTSLLLLVPNIYYWQNRITVYLWWKCK